MSINIIIPTYNHGEENLRPCLESFLANTNLPEGAKITVIANGCKDNTREVAESFPEVELLWSDAPLGYPGAVNSAVRANIDFEYYLFLNDDTVITNENPNWIKDTIARLAESDKNGAAGVNFLQWNTRQFLSGFAFFIKGDLFRELRGFDEIFSSGYSYDIDLSFSIQNASYIELIVELPIIHKKNFTISNIFNEDFEEISWKDRHIINRRYFSKKILICSVINSDYEILDINRFLNSFSLISTDIIIFDIGNSEKYTSIIKRYCSLYSTPHIDFVEIRNKILDEIDKLDFDIIFWVEPNEYISKYDAYNLYEEICISNNIDYFTITIENNYSNSDLNFESRELRIWRNKRSYRFSGKLSINAQGNGKYLTNIKIQKKVEDVKIPSELIVKICNHIEEYIKNSENINQLDALFYLGILYYKNNHYIESINTLKMFLEKARENNYFNLEEFWKSNHLIGLSFGKLSDLNNAIFYFKKANQIDPERAESLVELANIYYWSLNDYNLSREFNKNAIRLNIPDRNIDLVKSNYFEKPLDQLSLCCYFLCKLEEADTWLSLLLKSITPSNRHYQRYLSNYKGLQNSLVEKNKTDSLKTETENFAIQKKRIALNRPGAIGDILMTLNLIPDLKKKYPDYEIHYFCGEWVGKELHTLMKKAGIDQIVNKDLFFNLRSDYEYSFNLIGYPFHQGFPNKPMEKHLLQYFADELGLDPSIIRSLELQSFPKLVDKPYATLHAEAGWSVYKNWPIYRWEKVIEACPEIPIFQIGSNTNIKISGANHDFMGSSIDNSISLVSNATMHLGVDSFTNHLTNYTWNNKKIPSVILWGSTQKSASGYDHNINLSSELFCQPCFKENPKLGKELTGGICINPPGQIYEYPKHACMNTIEVEKVIMAVKEIWEKIINS